MNEFDETLNTLDFSEYARWLDSQTNSILLEIDETNVDIKNSE